MAGKPGRKPVKVGVHEGDGPPPGYLWNVLILDSAHAEACEFLSEDQRAHLAMQVKDLAGHPDPTHSEVIDVQPVEDCHELRDKGGILNKLNVRLFFCLDKPRRAIVVLGVFNKQNNGPTPNGVRLQMRRRRRLYLESVR